jgi:hypothetical protein
MNSSEIRGKACSRRLNYGGPRQQSAAATASECIKKFVDMAYERGLIVYSRRTRDGLAGDHFGLPPTHCR